jgi:hypothetical protein
MNRGALFSGLAVTSLLLACGSTDVSLGSRPQFANGTAVLTVLAYNGVDGSNVTGATLTMRIGPTVVTAQASGNAYTFTNIPGGTNFPIFAHATGYLDFAGQTDTLLPAANTTNGYTVANPSYTTATIAMFANTAVTTDYTVNVFNKTDGQPAASTGEVVLTLTGQPTTSVTQTATGNPIGTLISGDYGFHPHVATYPITAGVATIPMTDLIFGATYTIDVFGATTSAPAATAGTYLSSQFAAATTDITITPPSSFPIVTVLLDVAAGTDPIVLSASNEAPDDTKAQLVTAPLTINFAQPIKVCPSTTHVLFAPTSPGGGTPVYNGTMVAAPTADDVLFNYGNSNTKLTITIPTSAWTTTGVPTAVTTAGSNPVIITYSNTIAVEVVGTDKCVPLFDTVNGLCLRSTAGGACTGAVPNPKVSGRVYMFAAVP